MYLPTTTGPGSAEANRIRFKNLVDEGERALLGRIPKAKAAELADSVRALETPDLWAHAQAGMAAFGAEGFARCHLLSEAVESLVIVSDSAHVRPLLRALESNRRFWLVALSPRRPKLWRGSRSGLAGVVVPHLPHPAADATHDEHQRRASGRGSGGEDLAKYYRGLESAVREVIHDDGAPLVVAGQGDAVDAFRACCRYPRLLDEALVGTFDDETPAALHARAWPLVERDAQARDRAAADLVGSEASRGRASCELTSVARAVAQGRVKELYLADGVRMAGWFDASTGDVRLDSIAGQGDDVYDDIAEATILRGGAVHGLPADRMPSGAVVAAVFRW